jgi:hypothetical protein
MNSVFKITIKKYKYIMDTKDDFINESMKTSADKTVALTQNDKTNILSHLSNDYENSNIKNRQSSIFPPKNNCAQIVRQEEINITNCRKLEHFLGEDLNQNRKKYMSNPKFKDLIGFVETESPVFPKKEKERRINHLAARFPENDSKQKNIMSYNYKPNTSNNYQYQDYYENKSLNNKYNKMKNLVDEIKSINKHGHLNPQYENSDETKINNFFKKREEKIIREKNNKTNSLSGSGHTNFLSQKFQAVQNTKSNEILKTDEGGYVKTSSSTRNVFPDYFLKKERIADTNTSTKATPLTTNYFFNEPVINKLEKKSFKKNYKTPLFSSSIGSKNLFMNFSYPNTISQNPGNRKKKSEFLC